MSAKIHKKNRVKWKVLVDLCSYEVGALSLLKPMVVADIDPVIKKVTPSTAKYWEYWRYVLSSEVQSPVVNMGRSNYYFLLDNTSGGILGVFALTDTPINNPFFTEKFGWGTADLPDAGANSINNRAKKKSLHTIVALRRCLPVYEFGQMTGGKMITLSAMSNELLRELELQYSFKMSILYARSVHGKSSQYNRLHANGLKLEGIDEKGAGFYMFEFRKQAYKYLSTDLPKLGKSKCNPFSKNVEEWKSRWLIPRAERLGCSKIEFDADRYKLKDKVHTNEN